MSDDGLLVQRLQAGDLEALGAIYDRYRVTVYRTALAITRETEAADDILQEAFLRFNQHIAKVNPSLPLAPWLYRITVNLSYTWVTRRSKWRVPIEDFIDRLIGPAKYRPENIAERHDELGMMERAVNSLAFSQRVVVVLYYLDELSLQEIADVVGCPVGTVKSRLHYARENLRHLMENSTPASEAHYEFT